MKAGKRKFVIVGQGIAGSVLSMLMEERDIPHRVIDLPEFSRSSRIAAGVANPIILKRLKWVKDAEFFWPVMQEFYHHWNTKLAKNESHWQTLDMFHRFATPGEVNLWDERSQLEPFQEFLGEIQKNKDDSFNAPYGWGQLKGLHWLNTSQFLQTYRQRLREKRVLHEKNLDFEGINSSIWPPGLEEGEEIILCNGHLAGENLPELRNCFARTRGELIIIRAPQLPGECAYHGGIFALPLGDQLFKIGASYGHHLLEDKPTEEGKSWLIQQWEKMYQGPYHVVDHLAGVRPTTRDRKPLLGTIRPGIHLFNGLGSRGVMMAPYLGKHFLQYLLDGQPLAKQWDWQRLT